MDAYDSYRQSGEHSDLFDAFGESRDYWVRSTRERPDRIYPSEPIAGFLRDTTKLSGGWRQKSDAAALLHNRSEEHTSELQSLMRISYAVFCLNKKNTK